MKTKLIDDNNGEISLGTPIEVSDPESSNRTAKATELSEQEIISIPEEKVRRIELASPTNTFAEPTKPSTNMKQIAKEMKKRSQKESRELKEA